MHLNEKTIDDFFDAPEECLLIIGNCVNLRLKAMHEPFLMKLIERFPHADYHKKRVDGSKSQGGTIDILTDEKNPNAKKIIVCYAQYFSGKNNLPSDSRVQRLDWFKKGMEKLCANNTIKSIAVSEHLTDDCGGKWEDYKQVIVDVSNFIFLENETFAVTFYNDPIKADAAIAAAAKAATIDKQVTIGLRGLQKTIYRLDQLCVLNVQAEAHAEAQEVDAQAQQAPAPKKRATKATKTKKDAPVEEPLVADAEPPTVTAAAAATAAPPIEPEALASAAAADPVAEVVPMKKPVAKKAPSKKAAPLAPIMPLRGSATATAPAHAVEEAAKLAVPVAAQQHVFPLPTLKPEEPPTAASVVEQVIDAEPDVLVPINPMPSAASESTTQDFAVKYDSNLSWTLPVSKLPIHSSWSKFFADKTLQDELTRLDAFFAEELDTLGDEVAILPQPQDRIFRAFQNDMKDVRVVILGQDPYHSNENEAMGLSFSVPVDVPVPPSLKNIFKEIETDVGSTNQCPDLTRWQEQGVLLFNTSLTVRHKRAGSHLNIWQRFTDRVIELLSQDATRPKVFLLWGTPAQKKEPLIAKHNRILTAVHPSPLSAARGWFGSKHFSQTNAQLKEWGKTEIAW